MQKLLTCASRMKPAVHLPRKLGKQSFTSFSAGLNSLVLVKEKWGLQVAGLFLLELSAHCAVVGTQGLAITF